MADNKMTKSAGEFWVAAELARRSWAAALTRDGLERTDILAVHAVGERAQIEVQVKATTDALSKASWILGTKAQQPSLHQHEWFVLVAISPDPEQQMKAFVVPRDHIAAAAWIGHMHWLTEPGVPPGKRNAGPEQSRVPNRVFARYEGRWDLLGVPTDQVPVMLPPEYRSYALEPRVGLPPGHHWGESEKGLPNW